LQAYLVHSSSTRESGWFTRRCHWCRDARTSSVLNPCADKAAKSHCGTTGRARQRTGAASRSWRSASDLGSPQAELLAFKRRHGRNWHLEELAEQLDCCFKLAPCALRGKHQNGRRATCVAAGRRRCWLGTESSLLFIAHGALQERHSGQDLGNQASEHRQITSLLWRP
jgi:hypothetical protein